MVSVGGIVGIRRYSWEIGDIIDAEKQIPNTSAGEAGPPAVKYLVNPNPIQGAQMYMYIPSYILEEYSENKTDVANKATSNDINTKNSKKTSMTEKLAIGAVILFGLLVLLNAAKIIK